MMIKSRTINGCYLQFVTSSDMHSILSEKGPDFLKRLNPKLNELFVQLMKDVKLDG